MRLPGRIDLIGVAAVLFGKRPREWLANGLWLVFAVALTFLWHSVLHGWSLTLVATLITYLPVRSLFWTPSYKHDEFLMTAVNGSERSRTNSLTLTRKIHESKSRFNQWPKVVHVNPTDRLKVYESLGTFQGIEIRINKYTAEGFMILEFPDGRSEIKRIDDLAEG